MRRAAILVLALVPTLVVAGLGTPQLGAQEATPTGTLIQGVDFANLGEVVPTEAPQHLLGLTRVTLQPGATLPPHTQPGNVLLYVQSGTVALIPTHGDASGGVQIVRGVGLPGGTPGIAERARLGVEIALDAGDSVAIDEAVTRSLRNAGVVPAVVLIASLLAENEPAVWFGADATSPTLSAHAGRITVDLSFGIGQTRLRIPVGATVTWTNRGTVPHTATSDDGMFDSGRVEPGESFSVTFLEAGTIDYHCEVHPDERGTIVVR